MTEERDQDDYAEDDVPAGKPPEELPEAVADGDPSEGEEIE